MQYADQLDVFNLKFINFVEVSGQYDFPKIKANDTLQDISESNTASFNFHKTIKNKSNCYIHFYIDDYQFERIWHQPMRYIQILKQFKGVIGPDFSVYKNMPKAQQIFQVYKQRLLSALMQNEGINLIPNVTWSDIESIDWILEDFPQNSVIALSTNGCLNSDVKQEFIRCYKKTISLLNPIQIIIIGTVPTELKDDTRIVELKSRLDYLHFLKKGVK